VSTHITSGLIDITASSTSPSTTGPNTNPSNLLIISDAEPGPTNASSTHPSIRESHGIGSLFAALDAGGTRKAHHLLVPHSSAKALQPEDLNYLKVKGAFSLPTLQICKALVESYFEYVHPVSPFVDKSAFLTAYNVGGVQRVNLLLLWSMFSASASYAELWVVRDAGYSTKAQMKESFLKRAKSLFYLSGEDEKIVLVQSALLISFWFADSNDVMQTWYWTGIAFDLAQTMGLHRNPDRGNPSAPVFTVQNRRLWRRIWWNCVVRDTWVSYLMGRPLRIQSDDCDCPPPTEADFGDDDEDPQTIELQRLWLDLLELTKILRDVLVLNYRRRGEVAVSRIDALESLINHRREIDFKSLLVSRYLKFNSLQFEMYRQVALIALFHPHCRQRNSGDVENTLSLSSTIAADKVRNAASETNKILEEIISIDGVGYFGPVTVSLLPPAMQVHLMRSKSSKSLAGRLAESQLDVHLMVLAELSDTYPSAGILHDLFTTAKLADTPASHRIPDTTAPTSAEDSAQVLASTSPDTVLDFPSAGGLFQDSLKAPTLDDVYPLAGLPPFTPLYSVWQADSTQALDFDLNAVLSPDELTDIFL
jgi:hypothetical protein